MRKWFPAHPNGLKFFHQILRDGKTLASAMTSEEQINDVTKKSQTKKTDNGAPLTEESTVNLKEVAEIEHKEKRTNELMRLVYELPEEDKEIDKVELILNKKMLNDNPPLRIVEITEQNGCESELEKASEKKCDNDYLKVKQSSPDANLENKVVNDVLATNELIINCAEEFKELIERPPSDECSDEELYELQRLLEKNPKVLDRYMKECASAEEVTRFQNLTSSSGPLSPRPHHQARSTSVTSDLFQLWLTSSPIKVSDNEISS